MKHVPIFADVKPDEAQLTAASLTLEVKNAAGQWASVPFELRTGLDSTGQMKVQSVHITVPAPGTYKVRFKMGTAVGQEIDVVASASYAEVPQMPTEPSEPINPVIAKLGKSFAELNPGAPDTRPTHYAPPSKPTTTGAYTRVSPWEVGEETLDDKDYWSESGQVAYIPDDPASPGVDRIQVFAHYRGVFAISPRLDLNSAGSRPDPNFKATGYVRGNKVVAIVRNQAQLSNEALMVFDDGVVSVLSTQTGAGGRPKGVWPTLKLDDGVKPLSIALTTNNELAVIGCHDTRDGKGKVAIVALEGKYLPFHTTPYLGFVNQGSWSDFKLLGYVDLPFTTPDNIAASANGYWESPGQTANQTLGQIKWSTPEGRANFLGGDPTWTKSVADNGYFMVSSMAEKKVVFYSLQKIMAYLRDSWLKNFDATLAARTAGTWPTNFTATPDLVPTVGYTMDLAHPPTALLAGQVLPRWSADQVHKAYVATENGEVQVIDASSFKARYSFEKKRAPKVLSVIPVGRNPTSMCFAKTLINVTGVSYAKDPAKPTSLSHPDPLNGIFYVCCRGDRKIQLVAHIEGSPQVHAIARTFEDTRIDDPVHVWVAGRGPILVVSDFNGKKVHTFRTGWLESYRKDAQGNRLYYKPGANGELSFEYGHSLAVPGKPFMANTSNVN